MKTFLTSTLVMMFVMQGHAQGPRPVSEPRFPQAFVGGSEINTIEGRRSAGTAFLARIDNAPQIYLLSVRHLLGPDGGFKALTPPEQVPAFVKGIRLHSFTSNGAKDYTLTGVPVPPSADVKAPLFDLAVYKTSGVFPADAAQIAVEKPAIGERVWVIAQVRGGVPHGQFVHPAKVTENGDRWLVCEFENSNIITAGASGAPVLNAEGKVVGIYSGHGGKDGHVLAFAIPSPLILQVIKGEAIPTQAESFPTPREKRGKKVRPE